MKTPDARFLITADHILQEIGELRTRHDLVLFLCASGPPVDMTTWKTIDHDALVDLHTIKIPEEFDPAVLGKTFFEIVKWPLPLATRGDVSFVIGYPAAHRRGTGDEFHSSGLVGVDGLVGCQLQELSPATSSLAGATVGFP